MVKSKIRQPFVTQDITSTNESDAFHPQRLVDETGAWQIELNQDPNPGGGSTGKIEIQGKVHKNAEWVTVDDVDINTFDGGSGAGLSTLKVDLDILPFMRAAVTGTVSVANGTTADVWVME